MKLGIISGKVWATKRIDAMPAGALLVVELEGSKETIIALDTLGCGEGERVIVSQNDRAADVMLSQETVIDAIIVGVLD